jgi:hypothetical protein
VKGVWLLDLFRVESGALKPGREYRPRLIVKTDAGVLRPQLVFRKSLPWVIIEATVLAAVIAVAVMMR